MKRLSLILAVALAAVPVAGCKTMLTTAGVPEFVAETVNTPVCNRLVLDDKARYGVNVLYNVPAQAYVAAHKRGLVTPAVRDVVKPKLQQAYTYLKGARAAHEACDEATFLNYRSAMERIKNEVMPLIPSGS
jgi:hypothetical protein